MSLGSLNVSIVHLTDKALVDTVTKLVKKINASIESISINPMIGNAFDIPKVNLSQPPPIFDTLIKANSEIINSAAFNISAPQAGLFRFTYIRQRDTAHSRINLDFSSMNATQVNFAYEVVGLVRLYFKAVDGTEISKIIENDFGKYIAHREETLSRLEKAMVSLVVDQENYRLELENQFQKRLLNLEESFSLKQSELIQKGKDLERRIAEVDDREAKHARRATRESMKQTFKNRGESFKISSGTIELRKPIEIFAIGLIFVFGLLFALTVATSLKLLGDVQAEDMLGLYIKQITLGLAFASSAIFYIRWRNHWFERHAQEEFAMKKQEIDLDRATWAVELASEWVEEKKKDIPEALLNKITNNLFEDLKVEDVKLHPIEQLTSALFGASSNMKMKLGNGTELEYDRKGIKKLQTSLE